MNQEPGTLASLSAMPGTAKNVRVAVASSGLGHIARGVETWARDTADALHERGVAVTLFSGAPLPASMAPRVAVPCLRRFSCVSRLAVWWMPGFAWRWGLKSGYGLEQWTFWRHLEPLLRAGGFDVLHVQDPMVAFWCRRARLAGRLKTREVLAHGTEEPASFLAPFEYVQHLVPYHLERVLGELGWRNAPAGWCVAPNFVDTERFAPVGVGGEGSLAEARRSQRGEIRRRLGIPEDALVVGSAGAIKRTHKRMDYLIQEFSKFSALSAPLRATSHAPHLVIAGAREDETDSVMREARELLGEKVTFLVDFPYGQMPDFYRALDVFVLPSLFEMMGIVFVEAMACGVPVLAHAHPVMESVVGAGGRCIDMGREGALVEALAVFEKNREGGDVPRGGAESAGARWGERARRQVETHFAKDVVIQKYTEYYERII